jgi:alanine racemase
VSAVAESSVAPAVRRYPGLRPAWAEVDVSAVRHNVAVLRRMVAPAQLCAVVKADAYGQGAVAVGRAALRAGATWLAVALVEEGIVLRDAGIEAPVLVLSEPAADAMGAVVAHGLTPTLYTTEGVAALAAATTGAGAPVDVHVKVDTGMHRVGADLGDVVAVVAAVERARGLRLGALWTHLAVADETDEESMSFTAAQLERFAAARAAVGDAGFDIPMVHAANSAGALAWPASRLDMVRCGIAIAGVAPSPELAPLVAHGDLALRPALSLKSQVSFVRLLEAGERPSYGRRRALEGRSRVATVPLGYADGVPRRYFSAGGTVLIGGRRRRLAGTVTMDQILVDCGDDDTVSVGDEVVLIGSQGDESVTVEEWAGVLDTIGYEVLTGIGARVPRVVTDDGAPVGQTARGER